MCRWLIYQEVARGDCLIVLNGFVKIHRKLIQWGWYQDNVVKCVFLHLLLTARFDDGFWLGREIKAGQVLIGTHQLAKDLGFSRQQIRTALNKLKSTNEITIETTNKYSIVTVVNWEEYQSNEEVPTSHLTNSLTNKQPTDNQQITNKQPQRKNDKNDKNNNICANDINDLFEKLWKLYPIKRGKGNISKTQKEKLYKIGHAEMERAINRYIAEQEKKETDIKFYKNGSTFFNTGYIDYLDENFTDVKEKGRSYEELWGG